MKITDINADGTQVIREATPQEIIDQQTVLADYERIQSEFAAKETAKAAVIKKLGLTADEVTALLA